MNSHRRKPLTREDLQQHFRASLTLNAVIGGLGLVVSLLIGMAGYHWLGPMAWLDAFVNASMLLGGMGPVLALDGPGASVALKIFAGAYAMYCGVLLIAIVGLVVAPITTHVLHLYHLDQDQPTSSPR